MILSDNFVPLVDFPCTFFFPPIKLLKKKRVLSSSYSFHDDFHLVVLCHMSRMQFCKPTAGGVKLSLTVIMQIQTVWAYPGLASRLVICPVAFYFMS